MNQPETSTPEKEIETPPETQEVGLEAVVMDAVLEALEADNVAGLRELVAGLHYADVADLLERLSADKRRQLLEHTHDVLDPEVLSEVDEAVRDAVIEHIGLDNVAEAVAELETDDAVYVLEEMKDEEQKQVLDSISESDRALIEESLSYPEDSAGRMMQREVMAVPQFWDVGQTIDFMRESADQEEWALPEIFYDIVVVDPKHAPVGIVPLSLLLQTKRPVPVTDIMTTEMKLVPAAMDQEEVAFLFRQRDLVSAPVVDADGKLVGMITIDDVVDVIDEEAEEDIMRMGGVHEDDFYSSTLSTTRTRFTWLFVNLLTAILASSVIAMFQGTIEQIVALAVLMPIVASMGGNAGTQTMTVVVRALATKELAPSNAMRQVGKELVVGGINGVLFAVLMGLVAWWWFDQSMLGVVIALAMMVNLLVAGLFGAIIPLMLVRSGIDPAAASSVFLTTVTDVVGFLVFLSLGAWLLL